MRRRIYEFRSRLALELEPSSRRERRAYLVAGLVVLATAVHSFISALPNRDAGRDSLDFSSFVFYLILVQLGGWFIRRVRHTTAWPRSGTKTETKRQETAWEPIRLRGQRYGYLAAVGSLLIGWGCAFVADLSLITDEGLRFPDSPGDFLVIFTIALMIVTAIPTVYVGWFGPDEIPTENPPNATWPDSV